MFGNILHRLIARGLGHLELNFLVKIQRRSRGSCKLNIKGFENWRFFRPISRYISKTVQDTAIATCTTEDERELVCDLFNGDIFIDLK